MKRKILSSILLTGFFFSNQNIKAQFTDPLSTPLPWTLVGSGLSVAAGTGNFNSTSAGADNRMYRFISPNNVCLNSANWSVDVDFHPTSTSASGVNHTVLSMTSGSQNPYMNTFGGPYTNQNFVEIKYFASSGLPGNYRLQMAYKESNLAPITSTVSIPAAPGVTYYLRLVKSGSSLTLSAFTNAARTIHYGGSPVTTIVPGHYNSLNCLQFGGIIDNPAAPRTLTGWIDNISIGAASLVNGCNCGFWDDYANAPDWTQVGTTVTVAGGALNFVATPDGGYTDRRVFRNIGGVISASNTWAVDFDFNATAVGTGGPGHVLMALTAGTLNPLVSPILGYPTTNQDAMMVYWASSTMTNNPATFELRGVGKDGVVSFNSAPMIIAVGVQYFMRLERLDATNARISVFADAARTFHVAGSPQCFVIPATIGGLNTIQHGNSVSGGNIRSLTATIDNTCIRAMDAPAGGTISGPLAVCENDQPYIENTTPATGGNWAWTYQWESSVGCTGTWSAIPAATALDYTVPPISSKTCYRRRATGPCGVVIYSNTVSIEVNKILHPSIAVSNYSGVCDITGTVIASIPASEIYGVSYSWNTGQTTPVISVTNATPVTYTVTVSNACYSASVSQLVTPCYHPTGSFPPLLANPTFCVDWSGSYPSEYFWIMDNTMPAGAGPAYNASEATLRVFNRWNGGLMYEQTYVAGCGGFWNGIIVWNGLSGGTPVTPGYYYDWTLELHNCDLSSTTTLNGFVYVSSICRLGNPNADSMATDPGVTLTEINVFPNPGTDNFIATFGTPIQEGQVRKIEIMNSLGQLVKEIQITASQNKTEIDLSENESGIYFFRFSDSQISEVVRVVKQ